MRLATGFEETGHIHKLRWLAKSKVLSRVFELSDQLRLCFRNQHVNSYFVTCFGAGNLHATLTFLNR